jgi:hypothetical protein
MLLIPQQMPKQPEFELLSAIWLQISKYPYNTTGKDSHEVT